ncbi:Arc family DNA binding domain-containing protein [Ruminiclostridium herbifermentans]|uniref:Arc family DNA binding domain-containing protein n=1 Tax=Ruminiclostridium herbifermentans TaxID=2488810 RepID=A0A4U7JNP8_9FIRM|nr:Arc family DNA binding domain-containing protein [Ruminiclostridium herbifermentans]QNU68281.1 Arc family DNA binding domain-containing protein [Ruminiclostridium herbifermentans]
MPEKKSILLRLSPRMWEEISKWADDEFRSVNGQIEYILSEALRKRNSVRSKSTDMDRKNNDEIET